MGGYAYVISGHLAPERLERPPDAPLQAPSLWRRLLGTPKPADALSTVQLPNGDRLIEVAAAPLDSALIEDLRTWLDRRIEQPSRGTAMVLDYLTDSAPTVYVRGIERGETTRASEHYVQMMFRGCAGMTETSARVMSHWSALWYASDWQRIASEHLVPFGFIPQPGVPVDDEPMTFLPAGDLGYLEYLPSEGRVAGETAFELDQGAVEAYEGSALLTRLDDVFGGFMREGLCRCQLCDPAFGDASFDEGHVRDGGVPALSAG